MAESSYPVGVGTRVANDGQYEALAAMWSAPGVLGTPNDTAVAFADGTGTRTVKIRANKRAVIRGWGWYSGSTDVSLPALASNGGGSSRLDTVVLRFSRSSYTVVAAVVQGTAGAGAPALTHNVTEPLTSGTFEVPIAVATVAPGASTLSAGNVAPVTWYSEGPSLLLNSNATYHPPTSIGVNRYRHYDSGNDWVLTGGLWRPNGIWRYSTTLSASASSVQLDIPSYLKGVRITWRGRSTSTSNTWTQVNARINGVSTSTYNLDLLQLSNGSFFNNQHDGIDHIIVGYMPSANTSGTSHGHGVIDIPSWDHSGQMLTLTSMAYFYHDSIGNSFLNYIGAQWASTAAHTHVTMISAAGSFAAGTSFQVVGYP